MTARISAPATPDHAAFAGRLRVLMEGTGDTRASLAAKLGYSGTMVGFWRAGRYLPTVEALDRMVDYFGDQRLRMMAVAARTGRCVCGAVFDRARTKRRYCSVRCQRQASYVSGRKADPRQDAIDAMCRGCEPDGVCRDDGCALRPFSPFLFVALRRTA